MDGLALHEVNTSISSSGKLAGHSRDGYSDSSIVQASTLPGGLNGRKCRPPPPYLLLFFFFLSKVQESVRSFIQIGRIHFNHQHIIMVNLFLNKNTFVLLYFILARNLEPISPVLALAIHYSSSIIKKRMTANTILMCSLNIS